MKRHRFNCGLKPIKYPVLGLLGFRSISLCLSRSLSLSAFLPSPPPLSSSDPMVPTPPPSASFHIIFSLYLSRSKYINACVSIYLSIYLCVCKYLTEFCFCRLRRRKRLLPRRPSLPSPAAASKRRRSQLSLSLSLIFM